MTEKTINVAEAKKHFSELLGQVAFNKKQILITKRGKPMVCLILVDEINMYLSKAKGWLENDDFFFDEIDRIIQDRTKYVPKFYRLPYNFR